jgi:UDP-glucose 4-epimerase
VGVPVVRRLVGAGCDVAVLDDFSVAGPDRLSELPVDVLAADLRDRPSTIEAVAQARPSHVVHLAALHYIPRCRSEPALTLAINTVGTQHLLDGLAAAGGKARLVLASTADVYLPATAPHRENDPCEPDNVYGLSKLAAESLVAYAGRSESIVAVVARLFNVYGPGETNPHLIPSIVDQLRLGDRVRLGNLTPRRDYVYVDDVADALVALVATAPTGTVVNVGTGASWSVQDVVDLLGAATGRTIEVQQDEGRTRPIDRPVLQADTTALRSLLPWAGRVALADGLARLAEHEAL